MVDWNEGCRGYTTSPITIASLDQIPLLLPQWGQKFLEGGAEGTNAPRCNQTLPQRWPYKELPQRWPKRGRNKKFESHTRCQKMMAIFSMALQKPHYSFAGSISVVHLSWCG